MIRMIRKPSLVSSLASLLACGHATAEPTSSSTGASDEDGSTTPVGSSGGTTDVASTTADSSGSDGGTTGEPGACADQQLRALPEDPGTLGPWPVGARTIDLDGLTVEVWYPAQPGSERGATKAIYDIREQLPASEQGKISDADNPWQPCECYRELAPDLEYGPYPVIVFVHGTASFRTQSLPQMVHWASRGFVVVAADHPGLKLGDLLGSACGAGNVAQDLDGDLERVLAAVQGRGDALAFLGDRQDGTRVGMAGHSAGGAAIASWGDRAAVLVPLAAGGTQAGATLRSTLVMGGTADSVVDYGAQQDGYGTSPSPKRLVGIAEGGHLGFSEICSLANAAGDDLLEVATAAGVCGAQFAGLLFQCSPDLIADADAWAIIDYATTAAFEETLQCRDATAAFDAIAARFDGVAEYLSMP